jgi:hypothetical protein
MPLRLDLPSAFGFLCLALWLLLLSPGVQLARAPGAAATAAATAAR